MYARSRARRGGRAATSAARRQLARIALAAGVVLLSTWPAFTQDKADFATRAKGIVQSLGLQTDLPSGLEEDHGPRWRLGAISLRFLLWSAVITGAIVIAMYLKDILPSGGLARRKGWSVDGTDGQGAGTATQTRAQTGADELARLGQFVEAMHVLLLQALADLHRQIGAPMADSLTSREILRRAKLPSPAKAALQEMIGAVERAYFGAHPADQGDYLACRANFVTFVGALHAERSA
jgi:hypothetical protein